MTFRPMPLLTGLSVISLVILVILGNWQYARYSEKSDRPALGALEDQPEPLRIQIDLSHPGMVQQVYGFADSEPIWRRYAPGTLVGTKETVLVMIEATGGPEPISMAISALPSSISFDGVLTKKEMSDSAFGVRDDPDAGLWYRLNPSGMTEALGLASIPRLAEPVIMTVRNAADLTQSRQTINPYAYSKPLDPLPPERHFGYALTWWGMALGLIGVYLALHRARGRLKF